MKKRTILFALATAAMLFTACGEKDNGGDNNGGDNNGNGGGDTVDTNWVDLGLPSGLLWARYNVGATSPEGFGDLIAWGEVTSKNEYGWETYQYCNGSQFDLTKYCNSSQFGYNGFTDDLTTLEPCDDAATAALGNGARTPTKEEWEELINSTVVEWTTFNDVNGCSFTATNGKSIFVPAAGYNYGTEPDGVGDYGGYWTSSLNTDGAPDAWYFYLYFSHQDILSNYRFRGHAIRAVKSAK